MKVQVLTLDAAPAGELELSDAIFGLEPRQDILHRVVTWQLAKRRAGTRRVKTRGEIDRTTKKLYRQKGTGNARHGSAAVSQFRGGYKAMGPVVRSHEHDLNKKVRALGLRHALSAKAGAGELIVIDDAKLAERRTKAALAHFAKLGIGSALIVDGPEIDLNFALSARNLPEVQVMPAAGLNVYDILRRTKLVLTRAGVAAIEERLK